VGRRYKRSNGCDGKSRFWCSTRFTVAFVCFPGNAFKGRVGGGKQWAVRSSNLNETSKNERTLVEEVWGDGRVALEKENPGRVWSKKRIGIAQGKYLPVRRVVGGCGGNRSPVRRSSVREWHHTPKEATGGAGGGVK